MKNPSTSTSTPSGEDLDVLFDQFAEAFMTGLREAVDEELTALEKNYRGGTLKERVEASMVVQNLAPFHLEAREIIKRAAKSRNPVTRSMAAHDLGELGPSFASETRPLLEKLRWDTDEKVRKRAKVAMDKITSFQEDLQDK